MWNEWKVNSLIKWDSQMHAMLKTCEIEQSQTWI